MLLVEDEEHIRKIIFSSSLSDKLKAVFLFDFRLPSFHHYFYLYKIFFELFYISIGCLKGLSNIFSKKEKRFFIPLTKINKKLRILTLTKKPSGPKNQAETQEELTQEKRKPAKRKDFP